MGTGIAPRPPGPRGLPLAGSAAAFLKDQVGFLTRMAAKYGDVVSFRLGPERVFQLNHPDDVRDVLVTHQRCFKKGRGLERARRLLGDGLLTSDLTMAIVGETLFGADVAADTPELGAAIGVFLDLFWTATFPFAEILERLPVPSSLRFRRARAGLDRTIYRIIAERREEGVDRGDLLSTLLLAQDTAGDGTAMTDAQLRDEVMTVFLAGHETTAVALTWTWYLLSQSPEVAAALHEEVDRVLAGVPPTVENLPRLCYTRMVLAEAMRLFPPAWNIARRALEPYEVRGYRVPAGSLVFMSQYVVHRDPRFFPDPLRFDPRRWAPGEEAARPRFSYFPFGGGSRQCIGEHFAWMEGVLLLATFAQHWRPALVPGHPVAPKPSLTLRPRYGMRMLLERR